MYINPVLFGVLSTVFIGCVLLITAAIISARKDSRK